MAKLNGRRARYGWRDEINGGRKWKVKEHRRIRQIENDELKKEIMEEYQCDEEGAELLMDPVFLQGLQDWKNGNLIDT